jgi:hypothetical protein
MLIEGFVTPQEAEVLIRVGFLPSNNCANFLFSEPLFAESTVVAEDNTAYHSNKTYRDSWTAFLPSPKPKERPDDAVVRCIEERAALFQGLIPIETMETLQLVKYLSLP